MLNVVAMQGRLVADPELRCTPNGVSTCAFRIAVERSFAKQGEERKADFIDIVTWRQTAEFVCKYFAKGSAILVQGAIQTRAYEDKNANKRTAVEVVASEVCFCGEKANNARVQATQPQATKSATPQRKFEPVQGGIDDFVPVSDDDDLPF